MANTYSYYLDGNVYINLTNECSNNCDFCVRNGKEDYFGNELWLSKEPTAEEVINSMDFTRPFKEVVFCGFGEPTSRINTLLEVAKELKKRGCVVRLNTNGQGNLVNGRDITEELAEVIDKVNVSLNYSNAKKYQAVCHSVYGEDGFFAMIKFAKLCAKNGIQPNFSIVDCIGEEEIEACKLLAEKTGIPLRIREYIE